MAESLKLTYIMGKAMRDAYLCGVIDKNYDDALKILERIEDFHLSIIPKQEKKFVGSLIYKDLKNLRDKLLRRCSNKIENEGLVIKLNLMLDYLK